MFDRVNVRPSFFRFGAIKQLVEGSQKKAEATKYEAEKAFAFANINMNPN